MLTENQIHKINKMLENKVFKFKGGITSDESFMIDIDYKIKLLGYKKMIRIGEWTDYLMVGVDIVKLNDKISPYFIKPGFDFQSGMLVHFRWNLMSEIKNFLSIFDADDFYVNIGDTKVSYDAEKETITEGFMSDIAVRTVVKDIIKKVKNKKSGFFYLPDDNDEYEFINLPFSFSLELTLKVDNKLDGFKINGYYIPDEEVIEVIVLFNPDTITRNLYKLVGDLNELIAHELQHGYQEYRGELPNRDEEPERSVDYYTRDEEIEAQYRGFKRLSKLTKKPFEVVVKEWFDKNQDIHNMNKDETEIVIDKLLDYKINR